MSLSKLAFRAAILALAALLFQPYPTARAQGADFSAAAVVNDKVITAYDVEQRARLLSAASEGAIPVSAARARALDVLIDDTLRIQAAEKAGVQVPPEMLAAGIAEIAAQNRSTPERLIAYFRSQGVSQEALEHQIKAEVAWRELIRARYGARAAVDDRDIQAELARSGGGASNAPSFLVSEIFLPVSLADADPGVRQIAQQIVNRLRSGENFSALARNFSQSPSAARGGDRGWVRADIFEAPVAEALRAMRANQVSPPIRTSNGYMIVGVRDVRGGEGAGSAYRLKQVVAAVRPDAPQAQADAALLRVRNARAQITDCDSIDRVKAGFSPISGDIGMMRLADMPGPVRAAVSGLQVGQITEPIRSNDGFHVIMVCDKVSDAQANTNPEVIRAKLTQERFQRFSRGLIQELRRDAIIERR